LGAAAVADTPFDPACKQHQSARNVGGGAVILTADTTAAAAASCCQPQQLYRTNLSKQRHRRTII
jgi:hypothetical protein